MVSRSSYGIETDSDAISQSYLKVASRSDHLDRALGPNTAYLLEPESTSCDRLSDRGEACGLDRTEPDAPFGCLLEASQWDRRKFLPH